MTPSSSPTAVSFQTDNGLNAASMESTRDAAMDGSQNTDPVLEAAQSMVSLATSGLTDNSTATKGKERRR